MSKYYYNHFGVESVSHLVVGTKMFIRNTIFSLLEQFIAEESGNALQDLLERIEYLAKQ